MIFDKIYPTGFTANYIKYYWLIEDINAVPFSVHKVIPDGCPELIFHYGDSYLIQEEGFWINQSVYLLAGQFDNHFHLKNSGKSGMVGIKMHPVLPHSLFGINMSLLRNKVTNLESIQSRYVEELIAIAASDELFSDKAKNLDRWFNLNLPPIVMNTLLLKEAIELISVHNGSISVSRLSENLMVSERSLERKFKNIVGISPKLYCRIIRFKFIFDLVQKPYFKWTDIAYALKFSDQSHFIKNFQEFAGEDPTKYGFSQNNIANFFLNDTK